MEISMREVRGIVDSYLKHNGLKVIAGEYGAGDVLYPFLLMDLQYSIWHGEVEKVECRHELKRVKEKWRESYGLFTRSFFAAFSVEQQDEIVDLMDEYEKWMEGTLMCVRVAVMNAIREREFEEQKLLSACLLCNCLAQCAQIVWGTIFKDERGRPKVNREIEEVARWSKGFADAWMTQRGDRSVINLNGQKEVDAAMNALTRRLAHFPPLMVAKEKKV